jgi:hypothetical protein
MMVVAYRAIPVDGRLSDVCSVNDNVIRNTGAHQIKCGVCAHACHLSISGTIGTACRIQQGVCLGFNLL